jgi:hypothetical protein
MGSTRKWGASGLLGFPLLACGSSEGPVLSGAGPGGDDGGSRFLTDANASGPLDAFIENGSHVAVKIVTLACSGDCATVQAVGTGGHPPYAFKWEDSSTSATRQVCPTSSTNYSVKVTDMGTTGELARAPDTVQVPLTADVLACPDGGTTDGSAGGLCISNPSFEGTPTTSAFTGTATMSGIDAPPWVDCAPPIADRVLIWNSAQSAIGQTWPSPAPTDGDTYLFVATNGGVGFQAASEPLCETLHAGTTYSFRSISCPR